MEDVQHYAEGDNSSALSSVTTAETTTLSKNVLLLLVYSHFEGIFNEIVVPMLFGLISLIGIIGNALVIYVIWTQKPLYSITNMLLLNVAVADIAFLVIVPLLSAYEFATSSWPLGDIACRMMHYVVNVIAYVAVYTLVLVAIVRYMTIVCDVSTLRLVNRHTPQF